MKMISADHYIFYLEELLPDRVNDGKSEVHFRWDKVKKKWLVTLKGLSLSESYATQLIAAAVAKGLSPPPSPTHIPKPP